MVAAVAAAANWIAVARDHKPVEYVAKPLTMAALVAMAVLLDVSEPSRQVWFVAAAVFSLAGDVFLMLPRDRFVAGLASFFVAHLCYIGGLLQRPSPDVGMAAVGGIVVVTGVLTVGWRVVGAVTAGPHRQLRVPVTGYIIVIGVMVVTAFAYGPWIAIVGALLFFVSDSIIAWRRFVRSLRWDAVSIMVTYHLAQGLLLLSLASR